MTNTPIPILIGTGQNLDCCVLFLDIIIIPVCMYIIATVAEGATEGVGGYMATLK